ncbi:hypothetical protein ACFO6V_07165 [Promicromonospora alba]|uniref:Reverse transcriptase (RNA-dependent DNA polymerase) n=1 Tax=Promicromonospora alba TaxID=1616110 RepID=A0ABV9HEK9_9MICO
MEIMKPSGGKRLLAVPTVEDRVVERAVMEVVDDFIDSTLLPWSFAYRKGIAIKDAIDELTQARDDGARWDARADAEDDIGEGAPVGSAVRERVNCCLIRTGWCCFVRRSRRGRGVSAQCRVLTSGRRARVRPPALRAASR